MHAGHAVARGSWGLYRADGTPLAGMLSAWVPAQHGFPLLLLGSKIVTAWHTGSFAYNYPVMVSYMLLRVVAGRGER